LVNGTQRKKFIKEVNINLSEGCVAEKRKNLLSKTIRNVENVIYHDFNELSREKNLNLVEDSESQSLSLEDAAVRYQGGDQVAFEYIYKEYMPKLERLGYRENNDELAQELSIILERAAKTFNADSGGAKFNTYFWKCARNHMGTLRINRRAKKRTPKYGAYSMNQPIHGDDVGLEYYIGDENSESEFSESLFYITLQKQIFPHLKKSEIDTIFFYLQGFTLEEIGEKLGGITAPAVHIKLRRLANKQTVGKQLRELFNSYIS